MEQQIAERAKQYADKLYSKYSDKQIMDIGYNGYFSGATDQRMIDIEKACKAYCRPCGWVRKTCTCKKYIEFRKAME